jgi:hypothetical protein
VQEYIGIFPSKFNYNKKLFFVNTVIPLSFCKNKKIKKIRYFDFFFRKRMFLYYYTTTSKFASVRIYLDKNLVINTIILNLVQVFVLQEFEN